MRSFGVGDFLTETEVADILGISTYTLQKDRRLGEGLPYYNFGGAIRYFKNDVMRMIRNSRHPAD